MGMCNAEKAVPKKPRAFILGSAPWEHVFVWLIEAAPLRCGPENNSSRTKLTSRSNSSRSMAPFCELQSIFYCLQPARRACQPACHFSCTSSSYLSCSSPRLSSSFSLAPSLPLSFPPFFLNSRFPFFPSFFSTSSPLLSLSHFQLLSSSSVISQTVLAVRGSHGVGWRGLWLLGGSVRSLIFVAISCIW